MESDRKLAKEQFVRDLTGTDWRRIDILLCLPALFLFIHELFYFSFVRKLPSGERESFFFFKHTILVIVELVVLVFPLVLSVTVFSDESVLHLIIVVMLLVLAVFIGMHVNTLDHLERCNSQNSISTVLTWYRSIVNILAAICILAVDFRVYPRDLAKTESYGTGLMDIFVGAFIMCNALVSRESRQLSNQGQMIPTLRRILPLFILGMLRLTITKAANYQEHVTEYGVHWNFFLTLVATKAVTSVIFSLLHHQLSLLLGITTIVIYEVLLHTSKLTYYIMREGGRDEGFIAANREGIFSTIGYVSLYFIGVHIGQQLISKRHSIKCKILMLLVYSISLMVLHQILEHYGLQTSRRLCNLNFVIWTVHHTLLSLACLLIIGVITSSLYSSVQQSSEILVNKSVILESVNFNGLAYFLLANILTGVVNLLFDTLNMPNIPSLMIICAYMLVVNFTAVLLYALNLRIRLW